VNELREEILAEIRRAVAVDLELPGPVELRHGLSTDLQIDSMGALVLAVALEDRFRVKLTGIEAGSVVTVDDLVGLVERAVREDRAPGEPQNGEGRPEP
jgi:acyl carrier protein